jgi:predicted PurR-regulated permease PerM
MTTKKKKAKPKKQAESTTPPSDMRWESVFSSLGRIEIVLLVGGVMLLMTLIYTIQTIISPFVVLGSLLFMLFPLRQYLLARNLMWLAIILFSLWFLDAVSHILAPFVISIVFAYVLSPVVDLFEEWKVPRWVTSLILLILFIAGIVLTTFFILPVAVAQLEGVVANVSEAVATWRTTFWNSDIVRILERYGVDAEDLRVIISERLTPNFEELLRGVFQASSSVLASVSSVLTQIFYVILVPFLTFYVLADFPKISYRFKMLFPRRIRDKVAMHMERADDLIGHYLRGAITVAILQGIAVAVLFAMFDIKYALLLGILAGALDLVPYFGLIITMVISALVALFSDPPMLPKVLFAIGSVSVLHLLEVTFLSPRIVGSKVGMHPLLIILSLLLFMYFLGFVGLLIAVPTTALIIQLVQEWERSRRLYMTDDDDSPYIS